MYDISVSIPDITLEKQAAVAEIGRASQTACHLSVLLHDLHHLAHGFEEITAERQSDFNTNWAPSTSRTETTDPQVGLGRATVGYTSLFTHGGWEEYTK